VHQPTGGQGEEGCSQRPEIGARVDPVPLAVGLLGREKGGGAHPRARSRHATLLLEASQSEVEHLHLAVAGDEDVLGLEVAVDHPRLVRGGQEIERAVGDREHLRRSDPTIGTRGGDVFERAAFEQLHHEEGRTILGDVVVEDSYRPRVPHFVGNVALLQEAMTGLVARRQLLVENLHRGAHAVAMRGLVDGCHAAHAQQALESPLVAQGLPHARLGAPLDDVLVEVHALPGEPMVAPTGGPSPLTFLFTSRPTGGRPERWAPRDR
jgi:hypothetical protein